ncbi:MAG: hypothetical protein ACKOI3_00150 [Actinomycetota bacterium]
MIFSKVISVYSIATTMLMSDKSGTAVERFRNPMSNCGRILKCVSRIENSRVWTQLPRERLLDWLQVFNEFGWGRERNSLAQDAFSILLSAITMNDPFSGQTLWQ